MKLARPRQLWFAIALVAGSASLAAQCQPWTFPCGPRAGANGPVHAFGNWDPDGAGPQPELQLLAGSFTEVGAVRTSIASYDQAGGLQPFADCDGAVLCFATDQNGDLLVGGSFQSIGGVVTGPLARFDGSNWSSLGVSLTVGGLGAPSVNSVVARGNGDLVVGGHFDSIAGVQAWSIAERRNGSWQSIGDVEIFNQSGTITRVLVDGNGELLATGTFASIGGVAASGIARWDGANWSPLGGSNAGFTVIFDALLHPNGDVVVVGPFASIGGVAASWAARWDGAAWNAMPGLPSVARTVTLLPNGDLAVGGQFELQPLASSPVATWNGSGWTGVGIAQLDSPPVAVAALPGGGFLVGGSFRWIDPDGTAPRVGTGGLVQSSPAQPGPATWAPLLAGTDDVVRDVVAAPNGEHFAVGGFLSFGSWPAGGIGRVRTQQGMFPISDPLAARDYRRVVRRDDGALFLSARVGGNERIYRHQAGTTTQIGTATGDVAMAIDQSGQLLVGATDVATSFPAPSPLARRSNATGAWLPVDPLLTGRVTALCVLSNGDLAVGGDDLASGATPLGHLAIWNGSTWDPLQGGVDAPPVDLEPRRDGGFLVVGPFTFAGNLLANGIAAWTGQGFQTFAGGFPQGAALTVVELPTRELLVGGDFHSVGGVAASYLARWDGSWHDTGIAFDGPVRRLDVAPNGEVATCGDFLNVPLAPSAGLTVLTPTCATLTTEQSFACGGTLPLAINVHAEAWRGADIELQAAPFLGSSLAVGVFGLQPTITQLSTIGLPSNCYLELQPDILMLAVPQQAAASFALPVPNLPTAVGTTIYHQTIAFDFASNGALSLRTSPRIGMTVGSLW